MHILFVCTGNICRSPMAERIVAAYATKFRVRNLTATSAGTHAMIAHPIHREAAKVIENLGGDVSGFAARQINSTIASHADLVLTMTKAHRSTVFELAPHQLRRTFTLSEASRLVLERKALKIADLADLRAQLPSEEHFDIPDPIGRDPGVFAAVGSQIADFLTPVLEICRCD